jgi:hypothetical protein
VEPSSAPAIPEAGIVTVARVSGKGTRSSCHRSFQDQAGVMFAESGNIDAGRPELDLKRVHPFFSLVKFEWFLMISDV